MSLLHTSKVCYSNESYYHDELDTFEMSQARQAHAYVKELISQHWLTGSEQPAEKIETLEVIAKEPAKVAPSMTLVKEKADNLLRMTKSRAIARLKNIA